MGSSPLTRGKHQPSRSHRHQPGLIPAHAGKTRHRGRGLVVSRAHPRSRGENSLIPWELLAAHGSSPLTRGKPDRVAHLPHRVGLIPAHAGKTPTPRSARSSATAHPRSRGENAPTVRRGPPGTGSSPLTRGKRTRNTVDLQAAGLIPAHAGKTSSPVRRSSLGRAHPRSRGENS